MSPATIRTAVLLALSILAAPSVPHAQQSGKIWRIGIIGALSPVPFMRSNTYPPLIIGLRDLGYEEGRNVVFAVSDLAAGARERGCFDASGTKFGVKGRITPPPAAAQAAHGPW